MQAKVTGVAYCEQTVPPGFLENWRGQNRNRNKNINYFWVVDQQSETAEKEESGGDAVVKGRPGCGTVES
ncbi:MAG: hypothetical protein CL912_02045 [Deltaproteobacteria bacterium]|nr:hypothetical protein [Deltaproteobacteria bacterium]